MQDLFDESSLFAGVVLVMDISSPFKKSWWNDAGLG